MDDDGYKVRIQGAGLTLEREVPTRVGEQIVVLILTGNAGARGATQTAPSTALTSDEGSPSGAAGAADVSIREYLDSCEAKRSPDKITAIGQFLKDHRGKASFTRAELAGLFHEAAEPVPKNIPRDLKWANRVGWIAPKPGENATYYVTAKGSDVVAKKFPKDLVKKTSQTPGRARKNAAKNAATG